MKNLKELYMQCVKEVTDCGIEIGNVIDVCISNKKSVWGVCKHIGSINIIEVNSMLLLDDISDKGAKETIIHELLHTVDGCRNHGQKWKSLCEVINRKYGYNIKRANDANDKGIDNEIVLRTHKYALKCDMCSAITYRNRMSDFVRNPSNYEHTKCGGSFVRVK